VVSGSNPVVAHMMATGGLHAGAEAGGASRGPGPPAIYIYIYIYIYY